MAKPQVTIIVIAREHFNCARESLENIYNSTKLPFELLYVNSISSMQCQRYLQAQSQLKKFKLIQNNNLFSSNQARNIALSQVSTKYVLFINNDVIVSPNWLDKLVECAEATEASVVTPLVCIGKPEHQTVHLAGGEAHIILEIKGDRTRRYLQENTYFANKSVNIISSQLRRRECELTEFHCMLVRTELFDKIGLFDEALLSRCDEIDFSLRVTNAKFNIHFEPKAVVTFMPKLALAWLEIPYSTIRQGIEEQELASFKHFYQKWNLNYKNNYSHERFKLSGYHQHRVCLMTQIRQAVLRQPSF